MSKFFKLSNCVVINMELVKKIIINRDSITIHISNTFPLIPHTEIKFCKYLDFCDYNTIRDFVLGKHFH